MATGLGGVSTSAEMHWDAPSSKSVSTSSMRPLDAAFSTRCITSGC